MAFCRTCAHEGDIKYETGLRSIVF